MSEGEFSGALNSHQGDFSATRVAASKHRQPEGDSDAGGAAQNLLHALEQTGFSSRKRSSTLYLSFSQWT